MPRVVGLGRNAFDVADGLTAEEAIKTTLSLNPLLRRRYIGLTTPSGDAVPLDSPCPDELRCSAPLSAIERVGEDVISVILAHLANLEDGAIAAIRLLQSCRRVWAHRNAGKSVRRVWLHNEWAAKRLTLCRMFGCQTQCDSTLAACSRLFPNVVDLRLTSSSTTAGDASVWYGAMERAVRAWPKLKQVVVKNVLLLPDRDNSTPDACALLGTASSATLVPVIMLGKLSRMLLLGVESALLEGTLKSLTLDRVSCRDYCPAQFPAAGLRDLAFGTEVSVRTIEAFMRGLATGDAQLETLSLHAQSGRVSPRVFCDAVLPRLQVLKLSGADFSSAPWRETIAGVLRGSGQLEELVLECCTLGMFELTLIGESWPVLALEVLDLTSTLLNGRDFQTGVAKMPMLRELVAPCVHGAEWGGCIRLPRLKTATLGEGLTDWATRTTGGMTHFFLSRFLESAPALERLVIRIRRVDAWTLGALCKSPSVRELLVETKMPIRTVPIPGWTWDCLVWSRGLNIVIGTRD